MVDITHDLIGRITGKRLPLLPEQLQQAKDFCAEQIKIGNLKVLGEIPDVLRRDWLDPTLDATVRGRQHIKVQASEWRKALEIQCGRVVEYSQRTHKHEKISALLMWRAALAFASSLDKRKIPMCHIEAKRDEATLKVFAPMSLDEDSKGALRDRRDHVFIPDPMLATGVSSAFAIDMLKAFGVGNQEITLMCIVAAPEGIFHLLNHYPGIKIIAIALDSYLNESAYIMPGLGDAGEKYFNGNSLSNFSGMRHVFNDVQWSHLQHLLKKTNGNK